MVYQIQTAGLQKAAFDYLILNSPDLIIQQRMMYCTMSWHPFWNLHRKTSGSAKEIFKIKQVYRLNIPAVADRLDITEKQLTLRSEEPGIYSEQIQLLWVAIHSLVFRIHDQSYIIAKIRLLQ
jgi:hypothetical protein